MPISELSVGYEDRHIFADPTADSTIRESLCWVLPLPELQLGVIVYTWVHALGPTPGHGRAGAAVIVYGPGLEDTIFERVDGVAMADDERFTDWAVGAMGVKMSADMIHSSVSFAGKDVSFELDFAGIHPAYAYAPNINGCPQWWAWDRVEQSGRLVGTLRVGDQTIAVDTVGQRDHSWGPRDWGSASHWKWWNVLAGPDLAIHVMELHAFGQSSLHGYVHKDGVTGTVVDMVADYELDDQMMHTSIGATFVDDEGRSTKIAAHTTADLQWPISNRITVHDAIMAADVDGRPGVAFMELAWPPEYIGYHRGLDRSALYAGRRGETLDAS
jgi:hypothetical protein